MGSYLRHTLFLVLWVVVFARGPAFVLASCYDSCKVCDYVVPVVVWPKPFVMACGSTVEQVTHKSGTRCRLSEWVRAVPVLLQ